MKEEDSHRLQRPKLVSKFGCSIVWMVVGHSTQPASQTLDARGTGWLFNFVSLYLKFYKYIVNTFIILFTAMKNTKQATMTVLEGILHKENKINENTKRLFPGKLLNFTKKPIYFPCPFQNCSFEGTKLRRHLQTSAHKFTGTKAKMYEFP